MAGIAPVDPRVTRAANAKAAAIKAQQKKNAAKGPLKASPVKPFSPPGSTTTKVAGAAVGTVNVAALRAFLQSKGYAVPTSKQATAGAQVRSAALAFGLSRIPAKFGSQDAITALLGKNVAGAPTMSGKAWSAQYGTNRSVVQDTPSKTLNKYGVPVTDANGPGSSTYDPAALAGAANSTGNVPINENLAFGGAKLLDANALSQALAGSEWDNTINDAQNAQGQNAAQGKQNLHDIGSWYDQALGAMHTAAGRDTAITKAGSDSVTAADQAIIGSLGGDASAGASTVGAQAASDQGTLAALGASQDQYNADLAPIMQGERAGQLSAETARGSARAASLAQQLAAAKTSKAGSVASHLMDITNTNNTIRDNQLQRLLSIKQSNDALNQQNFADAQSVAGTNIAAIAAGAKLAAATNKPAKGSFGDTSAYVKASMASQVYADLKNAKTPQQAQQIIAAHVAGAGWSIKDPGVAGYASSLYSNWQPPTG